MSEHSPSEILTQFIAKTEFTDLPQDVIHETKRVLLDSLGVGLASMFTDRGKIAVAFARSMNGPPEATVLGVGDEVSCVSAAFANGEMINDLDYDALLQVEDRTPHVTPFVVPAPLAVAEREQASGKDLIVAVAVAHEVGARIVNSVKAERSWKGRERQGPVSYGYSSAAFGGTAGVCKILAYDHAKTAHALGITCHMIPVPTAAKWRFNPHSAMHKYCLAGWQGTIAVTAATLSGLDYYSDPSFLDGERGFWRMYGTRETVNWGSYTEGLGEDWHIRHVKYKRYPCCGMTHAHLDVFSTILREHNITPDEVVKVELRGGSRGLFVPLRVNRMIKTHLDAQFSNFFGFAAVAYGVPTSEWQDPTTLQNPKLHRFMDKVTWTMDPIMTAMVSVTVQARGRLFEREITLADHEKRINITDDVLIAKFRDVTAKTLRARTTQKAIDAIMNLEDLRDVRSLMKLLSS